MLETGLAPLCARGAMRLLEGETTMEDMLTRILIGGLGVLLFLVGVSMLVVQGITRSIRSIFAPRVIIVERFGA
jgi:hypothetical protein